MEALGKRVGIDIRRICDLPLPTEEEEEETLFSLLKDPPNSEMWRHEMKPLPAPNVPGNTEAERFDNAVRKMFSVSKEELLKREAKWKRAQARKKRTKKA